MEHNDTQHLIDVLTQEASAVTPWNPWVVVMRWAIAALLYSVVAVILLGARPDVVQKLMQPVYIIELIMVVITALSAGIAAVFLALPDESQRPIMKWVPLLSLCVLGVLLVYSGNFGLSDMQLAVGSPQYQAVMKLVLLAILPGAFLCVAISRGAPVSRRWAGGMAMLCVASLSYTILRIVEPGDNSLDVMLWCYIPILLLTMGGMALGKRLFHW